MAYRRSENVQVVIGKESSFGQGATTPDGYQFPFAQLQLGRIQDTGQLGIIRGNPYESKPVLGMYRVSGSLRAATSLETIPRLYRLIGGAITTTGAAAPYTHTIKGSTSTPSIWVERWHSDVSKGDRFFGVVLTGLRIAVGGRDAAPVILEASLLGSGHPETGGENQGTRYDTTPDTSMMTGPFYTLADATLTIGGSAPAADITSIEIGISLAHQPVDVIDGKLVSKALAPQWYEVTGRLEGLWDDADNLRALHNTTSNITLKLGSGTTFAQIIVPSAFITVRDVGTAEGSGPIKQQLEFRGYYDSTEQSSWKVVVTNNTTSYSTW